MCWEVYTYHHCTVCNQGYYVLRDYAYCEDLSRCPRIHLGVTPHTVRAVCRLCVSNLALWQSDNAGYENGGSHGNGQAGGRG